MSGLAFQKLNGEGTSAYEELQKLQELINEMAKLNFPDLYKEARMFAPNNELVPVSKVWGFEEAVNNDRSMQFNGLYYGRFVISQNLVTQASNGGSLVSSFLLYYGDNQALRRSICNWENDSYSTNNDTYVYVGFASSCGLYRTGGGHDMNASVSIAFVGFKLGEGSAPPVYVPPVIVPPVIGSFNFATYSFPNVEDYEYNQGNDAFSTMQQSGNIFTVGVPLNVRVKESRRFNTMGLPLNPNRYALNALLQEQSPDNKEEFTFNSVSNASSIEVRMCGHAQEIVIDSNGLAGQSSGVTFVLSDREVYDVSACYNSTVQGKYIHVRRLNDKYYTLVLVKNFLQNDRMVSRTLDNKIYPAGTSTPYYADGNQVLIELSSNQFFSGLSFYKA